MGDSIAVMKHGVLQQIGTPEDLHTSPANTFVATFIGSPAMNLLPSGALGVGVGGADSSSGSGRSTCSSETGSRLRALAGDGGGGPVPR